MTTRLLAVLACLLLACSAVAAVVGGVGERGTAEERGTAGTNGTAATAPTEVSSCTVISEPGRYVLTGDVENSSAGTCIRIRASDVVLDGNGHTVDGVDEPDPAQLADRFFRGQEEPFDPETNVGVAVGGDRPLSNVTVADLRVTNWRWGVVAADLTGGRVAGVRASVNGFGVALVESSDVSVVDGVASDNAGVGVLLLNGTGNRVANVSASENDLMGVYQFGGRDSLVSKVTARDNRLGGVLVAEAADPSVFGATVSGSQYGVYLFGTTGGAVTRTVATDNQVGIALSGSDGGEISQSNASSNSEVGALVNGTADATVSELVARENGFVGVSVENATDGSVADSNLSRNQYGAFLYRTNDTTVTDLTASDQFAGIFVGNATGGSVVDNTVLNTTFASVYVTNSTGVRVANNRDGLVTFESTDDGIGEEGGISHDDEIAVNQSDGLGDDELRRYVYQSIARAEYLRQLEFTGSITLDVITRERLERRMAARPSVSAEQSAWDNQYWEALFVVGEDRNATAMLENESTQILGSYYWESRRLTMVSDRDPPIVDSTTLIHELVHALQGQHFDVVRPRERPRTEDAQRGSLGLTEGDAEYVALLYEKYCGVVWDCVQVPSKEPRGGEVSESRNFARRAIVLSPYSDGPQLVDDLRERGGWEAVNGAYETPPNSTEQFVHADRRNEPPVPIEFESTARDGWREFDAANLTGPSRNGRATVGEVGVFTMFWYQGYEYGVSVVDSENHLVPNDAPFDLYNYTSPPSEGWGNDVLVPYRKEVGNESRSGYVWRTAWDTDRDARQFRDAYVRMLRGHGGELVGPNTWRIETGPFADAFRVVRDGRNVTIVNAPTVADLADLRPGLATGGNAPDANTTAGETTTGETTTAGANNETSANATTTAAG